MRRLVQLGLIIAVLALLAYGLSAQSYRASEHPNSLRLWALDVGQGDALLIETPDRKQVLVDGGPNSSVLAELSRVMPVGDKEIDLVISTHNDADHLAGLNFVLERYNVGKVWLTGAVHTTQTYQRFISLLKARNVQTEIITAGAKVDFGDLDGIAIWPLDSASGQTPTDQNAVGIVTYWQYGQTTFLLTGDIEANQEASMLGRDVVRQAKILKVAHHGSRTSSSENFLRTVAPNIALISVGRNNRYSHPHQEILARYQALAIPILRTDQIGTILCEVTLIDFRCAAAK